MAKSEVLDRDLNVQNEKYKQLSITKQQYIDKLKKELNTVEARFMKIINVNSMVGEDFRSQALLNMQKYLEMKLFAEDAHERIKVLEKELKWEREKTATLDE